MPVPHANPPPSRRRIAWASALLGVWLAGSALGFWWFTMKDLRSFAPSVTLGAQAFDTVAVSAGLEDALDAQLRQERDTPPASATVLHFWDQACACSRFNQDHVRQLSEHYRTAGVRFLVLDRRSGKALDPRTLGTAFGDAVEPYLADSSAIDKLDIPASPAAAVFDAHGQLAYFGPYSEGAACLTGNGDFVEQVLDKLLAGERPQQINIAAFGCFCDWKNHS